MLKNIYYGVDTKLKFFVFSLTRSISGVSFKEHTLPFMFLRSIWYWCYRERNKTKVQLWCFTKLKRSNYNKKREENRESQHTILAHVSKKMHLSFCSGLAWKLASKTYSTALSKKKLTPNIQFSTGFNEIQYFTTDTETYTEPSDTILWFHTVGPTTLKDILPPQSQHSPSFTFITYGAEVLLVLTDSLHLRSVQHWHIVGHGPVSFLSVLFLKAQTVGDLNWSGFMQYFKTPRLSPGDRFWKNLPGWQCSSSAEHGWCRGCRWQMCSWPCPSQQYACT